MKICLRKASGRNKPSTTLKDSDLGQVGLQFCLVLTAYTSENVTGFK